ncbi:MAG: hypothetical protein EA405_13040 [Rhodospirillales bacterium]|nr:MAG: hypothetical protein EA405_13040 [Rhodospirillales bacterium]
MIVIRRRFRAVRIFPYIYDRPRAFDVHCARSGMANHTLTCSKVVLFQDVITLLINKIPEYSVHFFIPF